VLAGAWLTCVIGDVSALATQWGRLAPRRRSAAPAGFAESEAKL
jgi:hypothetical protein